MGSYFRIWREKGEEWGRKRTSMNQMWNLTVYEGLHPALECTWLAHGPKACDWGPITPYQWHRIRVAWKLEQQWIQSVVHCPLDPWHTKITISLTISLRKIGKSWTYKKIAVRIPKRFIPFLEPLKCVFMRFLFWPWCIACNRLYRLFASQVKSIGKERVNTVQQPPGSVGDLVPLQPYHKRCLHNPRGTSECGHFEN